MRAETAMAWFLCAVPLAAAAAEARPEAPPAVEAALRITQQYTLRPNLHYDTGHGPNLRVDAYVPTAGPSRNATLVYFHGGGWNRDTKERNALDLLPVLALGWTVISVEYRRAAEAPAPAAVRDCRCALRWVHAAAAELKVDPGRVVVSGHSAGGHLALMTALPPMESEFDADCPHAPAPPPRAVVNWFGITDVADLLAGKHRRDFAVRWIGSRTDAAEVATRVSPLTHVRRGAPPVITIHGDADEEVPFEHAVRLHRLLEAAGIRHRLVRIPAGGHGGFDFEQESGAYAEVLAFLGALQPQP